MNEKWSTAHPIWRFRHSLDSKLMLMQLHLHWQHVESFWSVLTFSAEYHKCLNSFLDHEVVILGQFLGCHSQTQGYPVLRPLQNPVHLLFRMRSLIKFRAFTPANSLPGISPYRNWIYTITWRQVLRPGRNCEANWYFWLPISMTSNFCTNIATCQLILDFSGKIVRHDDSSVYVQWSNEPCESSRIQVRL